MGCGSERSWGRTSCWNFRRCEIGYGDEILAAGQAQQAYDTDPSCRVAIFDKHQKPRWHPIWDHNPIIARPEDVARGEPVHVVHNGPDLRPYFTPPFSRQHGWTFNTAFKAYENIAKIYLTPGELALGASTDARLGPYVLIEPWSKHENLRWPLRHWEALVASRPHLTFVQHVHSGTGTMVVPGAIPVQVASFREACGLLASCEAYIRGESGMLHAAAALSVPSIALWGGCMDWGVLGGYPLEIGVGIDRGEGSPCGSWMACAHCQRIMAGISVEEVLLELDKFSIE